MAKVHGKTPAQVILCWHLEHGHSVIPKSVNPKRIAENVAIFDFHLNENEIRMIYALDTSRRGGPEPADISTRTYSFAIPD
ncbi:aldo/keto reductase [Breoghania sp.]|uniref:aldo/keto reductase n=1 Tax=Breoghania sp. TaxID=2065378 RepID=UPI0026386EB9|nr:aldo/keto reductase [Breoghania sp.]MDJ0932796.1 aldo/keto reductase [Breoghania sp.]